MKGFLDPTLTPSKPARAWDGEGKGARGVAVGGGAGADRYSELWLPNKLP